MVIKAWLLAHKGLVLTILACLLIFGYIAYNYVTISHLRTEVADTSKQLEEANNRVLTLQTGYDNLVSKTNQMQMDLNRYSFNLQQNEANLQKSLNAIQALRNREGQISSNPSALEADLKAQLDNYEANFSCLAGNLQYCSQPQ